MAEPRGMQKEFRSTLWFKKGDLDAEAETGAVDLLPPEDRYLDDGTVTPDDRAVYSLVTGHTRALPRGPVSDGGNVDLLVRDIKRGRVATAVAVGVAGMLVGLAAILFAL